MLWADGRSSEALAEAVPERWRRLYIPLVGGGGLLACLAEKGWKQPAGEGGEVYLSDLDRDALSLWRAFLDEPAEVVRAAAAWLYVVDSPKEAQDRQSALDCLRECWETEADRSPGAQLALRNRLRRWPGERRDFRRAAARWPAVDLDRVLAFGARLSEVRCQSYEGAYLALPSPQGPEDVLLCQVGQRYANARFDSLVVNSWAWRQQGGVVLLDLPNDERTAHQLRICWRDQYERLFESPKRVVCKGNGA